MSQKVQTHFKNLAAFGARGDSEKKLLLTNTLT